MSGAVSATAAAISGTEVVSAGLAAADAAATVGGVTTLATAPSWLSLAGYAASGLSAVSSIAGGKQQAQSAKYNAAIQENNAEIAKQNATFVGEEGAANAGAEQQKTRATVGAIKSAQAANGIDVNSGSAVDVRSSAAELGELNAITIRSNAARSAYGSQTAAASDKAQAALDKEQASYDTEAGVEKAGTTLLGSAAAGGQSGLWNGFLNSSSLNGSSF